MFTNAIPLKAAFFDEQLGIDHPHRPMAAIKECKKEKKITPILLVEDDVIAANVVKSLLVSLGCCVDIAPNGKSALRQVIDHTYDLVILDIGLPDITGIDVARQIRVWNKHLPLIGLTARIDQKDACLDAGMERVLSKPLSLETAQEIIGNI